MTKKNAYEQAKLYLKTLLDFKWNPSTDTIVGFVHTGVIFMISFILSLVINKSTIMTILIRDFIMMSGNIFFCLWYIQKNNYKFEDFGLTTKKWYIYLPIDFILGVILLFLFMDEHPDAKLVFNLNTYLLIGYIMLAGIFEMIVFYIFLRKIFIDAFGILPGIFLAAIAYSLHHFGDQPEFIKLIFVGVLYASFFSMGNSVFLVYPFFWGVGACFDVLLVSNEVKDIIYPGPRIIIVLILYILGGIILYRMRHRMEESLT